MGWVFFASIQFSDKFRYHPPAKIIYITGIAGYSCIICYIWQFLIGCIPYQPFHPIKTQPKKFKSRHRCRRCPRTSSESSCKRMWIKGFRPRRHWVRFGSCSKLGHGYGSIAIHTIFRGMNIHLPAILMFTRGIGFWPIPTSESLDPSWDAFWIFGSAENPRFEWTLDWIELWFLKFLNIWVWTYPLVMSKWLLKTAIYSEFSH